MPRMQARPPMIFVSKVMRSKISTDCTSGNGGELTVIQNSHFPSLCRRSSIQSLPGIVIMGVRIVA
jgi:hypothetical protein